MVTKIEKETEIDLYFVILVILIATSQFPPGKAVGRF